MIAMIRRALLRRKIRLQDERRQVAVDMRRFYDAMEADASQQIHDASMQLAHLEQLSRISRMAGA